MLDRHKVKVPEHVCVLGLGPSLSQYLQLGLASAPFPKYDEIWTINMGARVLQHDVTFCMHDLKESEHRNPPEADFYKTYDREYLTVAHYDEYPNSVAFPIKELMDRFNFHWMSGGIPYMIGYATLIGVKKLSLYGIDYDHPGSTGVEPGKDCTTAWAVIGMLAGLDIIIAQDSSFMDMRLPNTKKFYGYPYPPVKE